MLLYFGIGRHWPNQKLEIDSIQICCISVVLLSIAAWLPKHGNLGGKEEIDISVGFVLSEKRCISCNCNN